MTIVLLILAAFFLGMNVLMGRLIYQLIGAIADTNALNAELSQLREEYQKSIRLHTARAGIKHD